MISRRKLLIAAPALWLPRTKAARLLHGTAQGGLQFNLILDPSWSSAPASYVTALSQTIPLIQAAYPNTNVTINMHVGYQTYWVSPSIPAQPVGASTSIGINVGISTSVSYSSIRAAMAALPFQSTTLSTLLTNTPSGSSLNSTSSFNLPSAAAKAIGLFGLSGGPVSARDPNIVDGSIGIGSGWATAKLIGVMLHEITHTFGRETSMAPFVFSRFLSVGSRDFFSSNTTATYFSIDGGNTTLATYDFKSPGGGADPSDFLNPPDGTASPQDPLDCFGAFQQNGANQFLSSLDNQVMNAMGFQ